MKASFIGVVALAILLTLVGFVNYQKGGASVILVKSQYGFGSTATIRIYRGTEVETVDLGDLKQKQSTDVVINKTLEIVNNYTKDGYEVLSTTEVMPTIGTGFLSFTLRK